MWSICLNLTLILTPMSKLTPTPKWRHKTRKWHFRFLRQKRHRRQMTAARKSRLVVYDPPCVPLHYEMDTHANLTRDWRAIDAQLTHFRCLRQKRNWRWLTSRMRFCIHFFGKEFPKHMQKDKHIVRSIENTLILSPRATQTEPYLAMCHMWFILVAI